MRTQRGRCDVRLLAVALALATLGAVACDPLSATDRDKGMKQLREIEAENRREYEWPISEWDAVGCDVCVNTCRRMDLSLRPLADVMSEFERRALDWNPGDIPVDGDNWNELDRLVCIAMRHGPEGERAILSFLFHDSEVVRLRAAFLSFNRGLANAAPARVMRAIAEQDGMLGFSARVRLSLWEAERSGRLEPPIHRRDRVHERP